MRANNHKVLFFLLLQFFLCEAGIAQKEKIDSLQKSLPLLKDAARIDCLIELSWNYVVLEFNTDRQFFQPYRDTVSYYSDIIYQESKKLHYLHGIAETFSLKAALKNNSIHDYKESEKLAKESLQWYELTDNKKRIELPYFTIAIALFSFYQYAEATPYLERSYYWAEKNGNKGFMLKLLDFMYEKNRDTGDYDKAFDAFQKSRQLNMTFYGKIDSFGEHFVLAELYRRLENYPAALSNYRQLIDKIRPHLNISDIWFRTSYPELFALNGQLDSARYYYNQIDSSKCKHQDLRFYLISIGEFYLIQKEYTKALTCLLHGLHLHRQAKDFAQTNRALLDVAKTYEALEQDNKALVYTREGLRLSLRSHSRQDTRDAYQVLYHIYQRRKKSDSALFYFQKYVTQKEIVGNDIMKGKFAAFNYEQKIDLLNNEKKLQQQQIIQSTRQKQILISGIVILFLLSLAVFRIILLKRNNEANRRAIAENELQLQKMESEKTKVELQQQATELEMQALRSQMNPHFIFNCLSSINHFILKNQSEMASDYLTKFSRLIRMVLNHSQKEAILLEDELEMLRLYFDLERLRFRNAFDYRISFHNSVDTASLYIPPLLLQPFAENAIWHGLMHKEGNGFIEIAFSFENDILSCCISDNGIGRKNAEIFKSKSTENGKSMGMQITSKRLALLNRNMEQTFFEIMDLQDKEGNATGTRVNLKIHYKDDGKEPPPVLSIRS